MCGWVLWGAACGRPTPPPPDPEIAALEAIGYLDGYAPLDAQSGVTVFDRAKAAPGWVLVTTGRSPSAWLMDRDGRVVHRWSLPFAEAFPAQGEARVAEEPRRWNDWRRVHLLPDGGLLAIHEGFGLVSIDADSHLRWAVPNRAHHDLQVLEDGRALVLTRVAHVVPRIGPAPILEDSVSTVDLADGHELERFSVLEAFEGSPYATVLDALPRRGDLFHTNAIVRLDGSASDRAPFLAAGNLLVSLRNADTVAIIDARTHDVVWAQTGPWRAQHDPSLVDGGRILVFDNRGDGGRSRLVEWDPVAQAMSWSYRGDAARPFQSAILGTAQRLPNGNTLATESERGRAFEVTPAGDVVWEYWNPDRSEHDPSLRATLLEVELVDPASTRAWLDARMP